MTRLSTNHDQGLQFSQGKLNLPVYSCDNFYSCVKSRTMPLHRSGVFIVNCEHISHLVLVFLLLTLNM